MNFLALFIFGVLLAAMGGLSLLMNRVIPPQDPELHPYSADFDRIWRHYLGPGFWWLGLVCLAVGGIGLLIKDT